MGRHSKSMKRARRLAAVGAVALMVWLLVSFAVTWRLTSRPRPPYPEAAPEVTWGPIESHRLATRDGQEVGAWFAQGRDEAPSVLILHGNKGGRWNSLRRGELLASRRGCSVLMISLRAHGDSTGTLNDFGHSAREDVIAAVEYLRGRRPDQPIVVIGVSLGSAAAAFAAGDLGEQVHGYVLETPYQDLKSATWDRCRAYVPFPLDHVAYLGLRVTAPLVLPQFEEIAPLRAVEKVPASVPVLVLAGGKDRLAPPEGARAIVERLPGHGRLVVFSERGHLDLLNQDPKRYAEVVLGFCDEVAKSHRRE